MQASVGVHISFDAIIIDSKKLHQKEKNPIFITYGITLPGIYNA